MPESITIDRLEPGTVERLRAEARRCGVDLAEVARDALLRGMPLQIPESTKSEFHDLDALAATWSDADADAFRSSVADFAKVDSELWT